MLPLPDIKGAVRRLQEPVQNRSFASPATPAVAAVAGGRDRGAQFYYVMLRRSKIQPVSRNNSRPISMRRISLVPAPIS